jgi:hypothetical protein
MNLENWLFGSHSDPHKKNDQSEEMASEDYDPNEESLEEGGEYMDDSLRMVEQPLQDE